MSTQSGVSIGIKLILTIIVLVMLVVGLLGTTSIYYSRQAFDKTTEQMRSDKESAIEKITETLTLTLVESARTALMQSDYSSLQTFVPEAAKIDREIAEVYVITDNGFIAAHSDPKQKEKPVAEVDPKLGPELAKTAKPLQRDVTVELPGGQQDQRRVFARPVLAQGKKLGTLVVSYSLTPLKKQLDSIDSEHKERSKGYMVQIGLLGMVFVLIGAGIGVFQGLRITRPIQLLASRADQIARGDLTTRVEVTSNDEIGLLAQNFNYMADQLQVLLEETKARAVLEKELELARTIQETLVPPSEVIERGAVRVAGHFQPATQCGGDWWTVHDLPGDRVLIIIGDVTGHGVPAAMITAAAKAACDVGRALEGARLTAGRLLELMNRAIYESARRKFVMTCFACIVETKTKTITYANAGHNFPYLYRAPSTLREGESEFTVLMSRGNRLGDIPDSTFVESTQALRSGDKLVFYTDGLIECESPSSEEFGEKRLRTAIRGAAEQTPAGMRDALMQAASQFFGDRPRKDDITLVVAQIS